MIFDIPKQERIVALIEHGRGVIDICLSNDDRYFVSCGGDQAIFLMGMSERKIRGRMKGHSNQIYTMDLSPDNIFLASGGMDQTCRIWDTRNMKQVHLLDDHEDTINGVAFSPNGKFLVTGSMDSNIIVYRTEDWAIHKKIIGRGWSTVYCPIISNAGNQVLFGADANVRIFDVETEEEIANLAGHAKQVRCVCMTKDDRFAVSGAHDRTIRIWNLDRQVSIGKLVGHENFVITVALTPDDRTIVSSGSDRTVRLWDFED